LSSETTLCDSINAEYLRRFPAECDLYLNWHWIEQYKLLTYVRNYAPQLLPELSQQEIERVETEFQKISANFEKPNGELRPTWSTLNLADRAARTDFAEAFRLINPISSQLIHGSFGGLSRHFDLSQDEHRISVPPSMEYVPEALIGAHMCVIKMIETLGNAFGWVPCHSIPDLAKDFHYAWDK
jgi:hypothetical protein